MQNNNKLLIYNEISEIQKNNPRQFERVKDVLDDFLKGRKKILPHLNQSSYINLSAKDLYDFFINVLVLVGGRESNYVKKEYKTILVQLTYQLGLLVDRIHPNSPESQLALTDLKQHGYDIWKYTSYETALLDTYFKQIDFLIDVNGKPLPVFIARYGSEVDYWLFEEIEYVLRNLETVGEDFKAFLELHNTLLNE